MKPFLSYFLVLLLAVALMPAKAFSQQVNDKQKAYKVLEALAEQIGSLQSGENRARMGSNIAESLWTHNEPRAREIFALVIKEIKAGLEHDEKDPDPVRTRQVFLKLREDTALRIGAHNPELALQSLQDTKRNDVYISDEDENQLNVRLAMVVAGRNPDLALKLGRESLRQGVSESQLILMFVLNKTSRVHASALLAEMVKIVPNQSIGNVMKNEQFYFMLARDVEPTLGRDPAFRDLMNYFTDVALKIGCGRKEPLKDDNGFCYRLGVVVPLMEKVDAKRVAPLKHLARNAGFPYEWVPELNHYADVYQTGSVDDLLSMNRTYPEFSDVGQIYAIRKLIDAGDFERARKLLNELTWQEESSKQLAIKEVADAERIVNEDTSAELFTRAKELPDESYTFHYLFRMATEIGPKNPQTTLKLLDRASEFLDKVPPEKWQMQWQIGMAVRYCQVKSDRCFTIMESVIRKLNELVTAATKLNGFDNRYLRNGEWNMTAEGGVGSLLTMLAQNAVYFAVCDFDRALALTSQFERREIRMMAQLKLAQGVLVGPPGKTLFPVDEH